MAAGIVALITAFLKFPGEFVAFAKFLQGTPEEARQKIISQMQAEQDAFEKTGRPTWDA